MSYQDLMAKWEKEAAQAQGIKPPMVETEYATTTTIYPTPKAAPEAPAPPVPLPEAIGRAAAQGATFRFGEEASAALGSALQRRFLPPTVQPETYEQIREAERIANEAARRAHPEIYGATELAASIPISLALPGAKPAVALSPGRAALVGGEVGGLTAAGGSEAPTAGGVLKETGMGLGLGAAGGYVGGRILGTPPLPGAPAAARGGLAEAPAVGGLMGAPARADIAETGGLLSGVQYSTKMRALGQPGALAEAKAALKTEPAIKKALGADRILEAERLVGDKLNKVGEQLAPIYKAVDKKIPGGVPLPVAEEALRQMGAEKYGSAVNTPMREAIEGVIGQLQTKYSPKYKGGTNRILAEDLWGEVKGWQTKGWAGNTLAPSFKKEFERDIAFALRDILHGHIDRASVVTGIDLAKLKALNAQYGTWRGISKIVSEKALRVRAEAPPMSGVWQGQLAGIEEIKKTLRGKAKESVGKAISAADRALVAPLVRTAETTAAPTILSRAAPLYAGRRAADAANELAARGYRNTLDSLTQAIMGGATWQSVSEMASRKGLPQTVARALYDRLKGAPLPETGRQISTGIK